MSPRCCRMSRTLSSHWCGNRAMCSKSTAPSTPGWPEHARLAYADLPKFRQSVLNLVNNALKFTERGRVSVVVNKLRSGDREWTEVHVSDTGIGIGREHLGKLFQPFSQVDGSATRKYNGTG